MSTKYNGNNYCIPTSTGNSNRKCNSDSDSRDRSNYCNSKSNRKCNSNGNRKCNSNGNSNANNSVVAVAVV